MAKGKKDSKKVRVSLQKNRHRKPRDKDLTRVYREDEVAAESTENSERVRAKGGVSRKRTVIVEGDSDSLAIDEKDCERGRVLMVQGLYCVVISDAGKVVRCYTRRLLKSLAIEARSVIATGDWVWYRPAPDDEGFIVRVEPRKRELARSYRHRDHIIAANIDQVLIVASLVQPQLKTNLIDRYLTTAESQNVRPIICLNKVDLTDGWLVVPIVGLYTQLGYPVVVTSAATLRGVPQLLRLLEGQETAIVGQSGVGKSSLLNALNPDLHLRVADVSQSTNKGRHTTTTAQMLRLREGGTVIDTPGVRQFEPADLDAGDIEGCFCEFRAFAPHCRFPGCLHTHEDGCAIKSAVADGMVSSGRYESYLRLIGGEG